jgi:NTE family protein
MMRLVFGGHRRERYEPTLVLSGGASLGAVQAGLLRAFLRVGLRPSAIVGTSVGALNGAFLAFHPDAIGGDELADIWNSLRGARVFDVNPFSVAFRLATKRQCLFSSRFLEKLVAEHLPEDDFARTQVPLYITATNLTRGRKVVFHEGPISQAILASTAIPGIFRPVEIDGDQYADGAVVAHLDLETAVELEAKDILAIDLSSCVDEAQPDNVMAVLTRSLEVMVRDRGDLDLKLLSGRARITVVRPQIDAEIAMADLTQVDELLKCGEQLGDELLHTHTDHRGRLRSGILFAPIPNLPLVDEAPVEA